MTEAAALRLASVSAWYGDAQALFDLSLEIQPGEIVALLGRNGAGKSTTLRAIVAADVRRRGVFEIHGVDTMGLSTDAIARRGVAWVPDDRRIFPSLTVRQNLQLALSAVADRRQGVPLDRILEALPLVQPLLPKRGSQLSGGEQQAVAIARALAARPRLLLLDEPTEGLAPVVVRPLTEAIRALPTTFGVSILLAEQNLSFVSDIASRVYVLDIGHIVFAGDAKVFERSKELQTQYLSV